VSKDVRVRVLFFAAHRELVGCSRLEMELSPGATLDDLFRILTEEHPGLGLLRPSTTFAVNRRIVESSTLLQVDDEVAFLAPVSGG
jgi:molybdopterin converting factor small subunit